MKSEAVKSCPKKIISKRSFRDYLAQAPRQDSMNRIFRLYLIGAASSIAFNTVESESLSDHVLQ